MALHLCSFGQHRFPGKSATIYPALVRDSGTLRWRFWACLKHALLVDEALTPYEIGDDKATVDATPNADTCITCGAPTKHDDSDPLYVTTYFQGQDRRDFFASLHTSCGRPGFLPE